MTSDPAPGCDQERYLDNEVRLQWSRESVIKASDCFG